jgi:hypothetical protein
VTDTPTLGAPLSSFGSHPTESHGGCHVLDAGTVTARQVGHGPGNCQDRKIADLGDTMPDVDIYPMPSAPSDPEAAALELIVRLPGQIMHTDALTEVLQDYCGMLHAEGAFAGLSWDDAKNVVAAVSFDVTTRDDAADFIRNRARNVLAGTRQHGLAEPRRSSAGAEHRGDSVGAMSAP